VALSRQADLAHGYLNMVGIGRRFSEAAAEAAGALRLGLAMATGKLGSCDDDETSCRRSAFTSAM
jgi:acetyl esterase